MPVTVSIICLVVAILTYGAAPLLLARHGLRSNGNPLQDLAWWLGTGAQSIGFLASFVARHALPLLVVQPALTSSLAFTAILEGNRRDERYGRGLFGAVAALSLGLAVLGTAAHTGPAPRPSEALVLCLILVTVLAAVGLFSPIAQHTTQRMLTAGLAFSVVAVLSRTLAADPIRILTQPSIAALAVWMVGAAALGQLLQTHALRRAGTLVGPLAGMWLIETVVPSGLGLGLGADHIRSGSWPFVAVAVVVSAWATITLARDQVSD